jgi:hypothetical protein
MAVGPEEYAKLRAISQKNRPADITRTDQWCSTSDCGNLLLTERDWRSGWCAYCRADAAERRKAANTTEEDDDA